VLDGWPAEKGGLGERQKAGQRLRKLVWQCIAAFLTYVATVVQLQVDAGQVHVKRVDTALDAGTVVKPRDV